MKKRLTCLTLAFVMLLSLTTGCGKSAGGKASAKDTLVVATMSETPTLSSTEHNATAGAYMNLLTYEALLKLDMDMKPVPCLATAYKNISETEWEFKLRKGVKFHNGDVLTAEDVKASLEYAMTFVEIKTETENIKEVKIKDPETIIITTKTPCAVILENLSSFATSILPKKLIDEGHDFNTSPIGTGPYVLKNWVRGDKLDFEAFADYWGDAPKIKNLTWKIIPEGSSRTIALEAGEVDFIVEVEAMDVERLKTNKNVAMLEFDAVDLNYLNLNNTKPGLNNPDVRHAINCAIDKKSVVTVALNGIAVPAVAQVPMNLEGGSDKNTDQYDVAKAKEWMKKSGVDPASVELAIICSNDMKKRAGEVIQANLKEIGINATIETMDLATYLSHTSDGNYTGAIGGYNIGSQAMFVQALFRTGFNKWRLSDAKIDAQIDEAMQTIDAGKRKKLLEKLSAELNELCPLIPLWQPVQLRAFNSKLGGIEANARGTMYFENIYWKD